MFVTIRAKLIGLSFLSLLFILTVSGAGYYGGYELKNALSDTRGNFEAINSYMRADAAHGMVRADVLEILRAAKSGAVVEYEDAVKGLNEHLKILTANITNNAAFAVLSEKSRKAIAAVRTDTDSYAKLAQKIALMAKTDGSGAEAQFNTFNDAFRLLESDRAVANNLIASEMDESRAVSEKAIWRSQVAVTAVLATALYFFILYLHLSGYR